MAGEQSNQSDNTWNISFSDSANDKMIKTIIDQFRQIHLNWTTQETILEIVLTFASNNFESRFSLKRKYFTRKTKLICLLHSRGDYKRLTDLLNWINWLI